MTEPGPTYRRTRAVVHLGAIRRNLSALTPAGVDVMAVVKADAYGHGGVEVARAALEAGATSLGVALVEEGLRLRGAGIASPILVLSEFPRGAERDALEARLTPTLYTDAGLDGVASAAGTAWPAAGATVSSRSSEATRVGVHVKVDTGMHRVGLPPERAEPFVRRVLEAGLAFEGLWSHFA